MPTRPNDCQLKRVEDSSEAIASRDKIRGAILRLLSAAERRIVGYRKKLNTGFSPVAPVRDAPKNLGGKASATAGGAFEAGDLIEVCSLEEIRSTLDSSELCQGLQFMAGMEKYCGNRFQILKPVRSMFDERKWKMVALKNVYTLEGVICEGIGMYDKESCDRCCYAFWKDRWLKKVDPA
jgi:hypothetical protein